MAQKKQFYLGKFFDQNKDEITTEKFFFDPPDLNTHMIVTGMTGSGKTGLCIGLIEEAALQGIPAILIDPKGDLTNLMLTFPDFNPADFSPWIDPGTARRENTTVEKLAEKTASDWKQGLADWELGSQEMRSLRDAVNRTIYTPGSSAGLPISILASFNPPDIDWEENEELLREKISATVTALLTLIGLKDIDPLRSREHILLANIMEYNWKRGLSLDLTSLILQTQNPPLERLGALSLNDFFSKKDRAALAMRLNNFLASPTFQTWIEGQSLDIQQILYTADGRPRHSIFYLAHLGEAERMFFITLLYSAIESWMRRQAGTSNLRALVYFDEIHGYLPPIANPPSKPLIIRLFKTARAYGLGLILTTQNPVDVDYKALSNAGTWMIGRLQTDQDKQRLLDGLESAAGGVQRKEFDRLISALGKRVFLCHNVHAKKPAIFYTRWAMSYLAGPLTITQIPALNKLAGARPYQTEQTRDADRKTAIPTAVEASKSSSHKPEVSVVREMFLPVRQNVKGLIYQPALLASAEIRYISRTPQVNFSRTITALVHHPRQVGQSWDDHILPDFDPHELLEKPQSGIDFGSIPEYMADASWWSSQQKDFEQWIYETDTVAVRTHKDLGLAAGPEVSKEKFHEQCRQAAQDHAQREITKLETKFASRRATLENRIRSQETRIEKYKKETATRGLDAAVHIGTSLFKLSAKKKLTGLSTSATKARMTSDARERLKEAETLLESYQADLQALDEEMEQEKKLILDKWESLIEDFSEIQLTPTKQNIHITYFGIGWDAV